MSEKNEIEALQTKKNEVKYSSTKKAVVNIFPGKSKQMKVKRSDVESGSDEDLCYSFHDLSDDASNISVNEFWPLHQHEDEEQEEAMADAFLETDFLSSQGNWF
jgi:hypothetical protein